MAIGLLRCRRGATSTAVYPSTLAAAQKTPHAKSPNGSKPSPNRWFSSNNPPKIVFNGFPPKATCWSPAARPKRLDAHESAIGAPLQSSRQPVISIRGYMRSTTRSRRLPRTKSRNIHGINESVLSSVKKITQAMHCLSPNGGTEDITPGDAG